LSVAAIQARLICVLLEAFAVSDAGAVGATLSSVVALTVVELALTLPAGVDRTHTVAVRVAGVRPVSLKPVAVGVAIWAKVVQLAPWQRST